MNTEKEHTEEDILRKHQPDTLEEEQEGHEQEIEADVEEAVDYSHLSKQELVHVTEGLLKEQDYKKTDAILRQVKHVFDEIKEKERGEALEKFITEGGEQDDFDFKADELTHRFEQAFRQLK